MSKDQIRNDVDKNLIDKNGLPDTTLGHVRESEQRKKPDPQDIKTSNVEDKQHTTTKKASRPSGDQK